MKLSQIIISIGFIYFLSLSYAAEKQLLNISADQFSPGFSMVSDNQQLYGFDIDMMNYVCDKINRKCNFRPMIFSKLLDSIVKGYSDVAVGSIAISSERLNLVNFSSPYLSSQGRVIGLKKSAPTPFMLKSLDKQKIGVVKGAIIKDILQVWSIDNPIILEFPTVPLLIDALNNGEVSYILAPNLAALFWLSQDNNAFVALGKPFDYGFGLGIAVTKNNPQLLAQINQALSDYLASPQFKQSYNTYLYRWPTAQRAVGFKLAGLS